MTFATRSDQKRTLVSRSSRCLCQQPCAAREKAPHLRYAKSHGRQKIAGGKIGARPRRTCRFSARCRFGRDGSRRTGRRSRQAPAGMDARSWSNRVRFRQACIRTRPPCRCERGVARYVRAADAFRAQVARINSSFRPSPRHSPPARSRHDEGSLSGTASCSLIMRERGLPGPG